MHVFGGFWVQLKGIFGSRDLAASRESFLSDLPSPSLPLIIDSYQDIFDLPWVPGR
jgi:hypothetical protein